MKSPTTVDPLVADLTYRRKRQGMPRAHLADFAGLSRAYMGRIEAGESSPSLQVLRRLANALGVDLVLAPKGEETR